MRVIDGMWRNSNIKHRKEISETPPVPSVIGCKVSRTGDCGLPTLSTLAVVEIKPEVRRRMEEEERGRMSGANLQPQSVT